MQFSIEPAQQHHAVPIQHLIQHAFSDNNVRRDDVARVISDISHHTWVALSQGQVIGFVDTFNTTSVTGQQRLEIDLLAVHANFRGQKVGATLILQSLGQVTQSARAIVNCQNVAAQYAFRRQGFIQGDNQLALYVASGQHETGIPHIDMPYAHLCTVNTMTYRGVWLEQIQNEQVFARARSQFSKQQLIDALLKDNNLILAAQQADFSMVGCYHEWFCWHQ